MSKQQRFILVYLLGCEKYTERYISLIRDVAEEIGEGEGDKIINYKELAEKDGKEEELIRNLGLDPKLTSIKITPHTVEKREQDHRSQIRKVVGSFRQSFSRSVRRLEDRGLVFRDSGVWDDYWENGARKEGQKEAEEFNPSEHVCDLCGDREASSKTTMEGREKWFCDKCFEKVHKPPKRTTNVFLTEKGKKVAEKIKRKAKDGRYNLSFDTL